MKDAILSPHVEEGGGMGTWWDAGPRSILYKYMYQLPKNSPLYTRVDLGSPQRPGGPHVAAMAQPRPAQTAGQNRSSFSTSCG